MRILVTGAAGFIGSHLAERLVDLRHEVLGIDNFNNYYSRQLKDLNRQDIEKKGVIFFELDLVKDDLTEVVKDVEIVYHLAAQPGISSRVPLDDYIRNNITATHKLLKALEDSKTLKLFVNTATSSVYGIHATDSEEVAPKPSSDYGVTKLAAEQLVLAWQRDKGFPACSIRPFSIYGPRERPEKLYPRLIKAILDDSYFLPLFEGSTAHIRSYTYVDDLIDGYVAVLDHINDCIGEIFNLGTDKVITTGEGIKIVEKIMGKEAKKENKPKRVGDQLETRATIDKARKVLGYNPSTTPEEGLRKEVEWYEERIWNAKVKVD